MRCPLQYLRPITICCAFVLTGCMMQQTHYKSMSKLRQESATNYSQQVLDTIVDVHDRARLPVFFSVENGSSLWNPSYSGSGVALIPMLTVGKTDVSGNLLGGETMSNELQYNDYGSAAMSRVTALYNLLCFPIEVAGVTMPNGTLFTIVDKADVRDHFLLWSKTADGQYLGVTKEKNEKFIHFAHDVIYWTRHATPDLTDLQSTTGKLYRLAVAYEPSEALLIHAVRAKPKIQQALANAQTAYKEAQQVFETLKNEARSSRTNAEVMTALLKFELDNVQAHAKHVADITVQLRNVETEIAALQDQLKGFLSMLQQALNEIVTYDSDVSDPVVAAIMEHLHKNIDTILTGDPDKIKATESLLLPYAPGYKANEPVDELYRERFESLPAKLMPTFDITR